MLSEVFGDIDKELICYEYEDVLLDEIIVFDWGLVRDDFVFLSMLDS